MPDTARQPDTMPDQAWSRHELRVHRRDIRTFDNRTGRNIFYRALLHPLVAPAASGLVERLAAETSVAIYDPTGYFTDFAAVHDISAWAIEGIYVQRIEDVGRKTGGLSARPLTELAASKATCLLVADLDGEGQLARLGPYRPAIVKTESFDSLRLPAEFLTARDRPLDPLNFVSDFLFFRDASRFHTAVSTINYWHDRGAKDTKLWCRLFGAAGEVLATWEQPLEADAGSIMLDSLTVRERFGLGDFTGSLFVHVIGAAAHDTLKYAVDVFDDTGTATATHDSNPWAADFYAGLPAARPGETVHLWIQNCYPTPIPAGAVGLRLIGKGEFVGVAEDIPPYGTAAVDPAKLFPKAQWPSQFEIRADRYFCRPRYEIHLADGYRSVAHANVERTDLKPATDLPEATRILGKGFILPAPILPVADWAGFVLPTPMATEQSVLTLTLRAYDPEGGLIAERALGKRLRADQTAISTDDILAGATPKDGYGHLELGYDFTNGAEGDGWMHALFRYDRRDSGRSAETSFGSHMFNVPATWRSEPNSYIGKPPGLTTRLYLRLTERPGRVLCHLIYPTSGQWREFSETDLILYTARGKEITRRRVAIPCSGSRLIDTSTLFDGGELKQAAGGYVIVRDTTCRLFGYHLFAAANGGVALDHMFGF